ncbi:MAG: hypothetical protein GF317_22390 [Candidatus Lokiarchaeota archaeon]|nr:hypothetical protein [Candidatus Lokiarchaeota archaeon]MBD3202210.1 hypothetical protein [Candidatus Lokiarchaeota archaeon]
MIMKKSTKYDCKPELMFKEILDPSNFQEITEPLLSFIPLDNTEGYPTKWEENDELHVNLILFGVISLGKHSIKVVNIGKYHNGLYLIQSQEGGEFTEIWNHDVIVERLDNDTTKYTDIIKLKAGLKTPFVWIFAKLFYWHRQRKWRKILKRKSEIPRFKYEIT